MNYGIFGGQYVPQELKEKLSCIEEKFNELKKEKNDEYLISIHLHINIQRFHVLLMQYLR